MKPFPVLRVWCDPVARSGPECMAVDELLLQGLDEEPVLRFYDWDGAWVSVGYFGDLEAAREVFGESVSLVRRWTGGGVVVPQPATKLSPIINAIAATVIRLIVSYSHGVFVSYADSIWLSVFGRQ